MAELCNERKGHQEPLKDKITRYYKRVKIAMKNETFRYIVKRILSSCLTLLLIIAVVTALIRLIPETKLYNIGIYNKLRSQSLMAAESYKNVQLFKFGRVTLEGNSTSVFYNIFQYIYWILPIPKDVPITWDRRYEKVITEFEGLSYLGRSMSTNQFVTDMLSERMGISFRISIISVIFTYIIAYPLGIAMAKKPGGLVDKIGNVFVVLNYAIPALVFYLVMNKIFGSPTSIFGAFKFGFFYEEGRPITLFAPIFCMVFLSIPGVSIWVRRFMIDELSSDYVKFARSKGLSENRIMYTHVLRNACVPLIRSIPAVFLTAIIGSYYVEMIWGIPGTGRLLITALQGSSPDVPVIQGLTVIYSGISMLSFLLGDIITVFFDPRIKLTAK